MKALFTIFMLVLAAEAAIAQIPLQKVVETEHSFAALAAEKGTRAAFLANMTDDAVIFNPDKLNAKALWESRGESKSLLSWAPNFADVSADGSVGYTTGNWEFRRTKTDDPVGFGEFITVWVRQPDGKYKFVVDIGVEHAKPARYSTDWVTTKDKTDPNKRFFSAPNAVTDFEKIVVQKGLVKALNTYADDNIRLYREEKAPFLGKPAAIAQTKIEKGKLEYEVGGTVYSAGNLAYLVKAYTFTDLDNHIQKGNAVQIWKFSKRKWKIVLDILKPIPAK